MSSDQPTPTALAVYVPPEEYRGDITWDPTAAAYLEGLARRFAISGEMVPKEFRGKPADCAIVLEMAHRLRVTPFMMFQSLFILHGKPSLSAQFLIGMANAAKRPIKFRDVRTPGLLPFRRVNKDGAKDVQLQNWSSTAFFADSPEDKVTVDMEQAMTAGWAHNAKYSEIPAQMLGYRAATFLVRRYLPHLAMGLATIDEVADDQAMVVDAEVVPGAPTPPRGMDAVRAAVTTVGFEYLSATAQAEVDAARDAERAKLEAERAKLVATVVQPEEDPAAAKAKAELADLRAKVKAIHDLPPEDPRRVRLIAYGNANQIRRWGGLGAEGCREALVAAEQFPTPEVKTEPAPAAKVTLSQEAVIAIRTLEKEINAEQTAAEDPWPERDLAGWSPEQGAAYLAELNAELDRLFPQGGE